MNATTFARKLRSEIKQVIGHWTFTAAAVISLAIATACLARILDKRSVWQEDDVTIRDLLLVDGGKRAVILVATFPANGVGARVFHLGIQAMDTNNFRTLWSGFKPSCLTSSPSRRNVFFGTWDGCIYAGTLAKPDQPVVRIGRHVEGGVDELLSSPDGICLLSKGLRVLCAWNVPTQTLKWQRGDLDVLCLAAHPLLNRAACGTSDGELIELDVRSGEVLRRLPRHAAKLTSVQFNSRGDLLASIAEDGSIALTRWPDLKPIWDEREGIFCATGSRIAAFSPCDKYLVVSAKTDAAKLVVWNIQTGDLAGNLLGHTKPILGACFVEQGKLCSWSLDDTIRTWDLASCASLRVLECELQTPDRTPICDPSFPAPLIKRKRG